MRPRRLAALLPSLSSGQFWLMDAGGRRRCLPLRGGQRLRRSV